MMLPCLVPAAAFAGFLLPAALLGALLLSEFADGCGLLGRVDLAENWRLQRDISRFSRAVKPKMNALQQAIS